jgi:hypothetical protein
MSNIRYKILHFYTNQVANFFNNFQISVNNNSLSGPSL